MSLPQTVRVTDVFVPGGLPTITYNPRAGLKLEEKVRAYLDERHSILSLTGPTKSGKTVLLKSILGQTGAIWLSGGVVRSAGDFWSAVGDELGVYVTEETTTTTGHDESTGTRITGGVRPAGFGVEGEKSSSRADSVSAA